MIKKIACACKFLFNLISGYFNVNDKNKIIVVYKGKGMDAFCSSHLYSSIIDWSVINAEGSKDAM